ncbi:MAG: alpha-1,2-fucosyltransferase [bacterium]
MIIVRLSGGMGNQMFQYAAGRALALKHDVSLALDPTFLNHRNRMPKFLRPHFVFRNFDLDVFNIQARIAKPSEISFRNRPFFSGWLMLAIDAALRKIAVFPGWEKFFSFDKKVLELGPDTYLEGYWQSPKYFSAIEEIIRKDFTLALPLSEKSEKLKKEIQSGVSVCVHVRRADFVASSFHGTFGKEYYEAGIALVAKSVPVGKVYVFSDDIAWCEKNLRFDVPTTFVGNEHAGRKGEGHLALMSACKHFIIPNSTFSWWAAWLGEHKGKIVITPKKWFADKSMNTNDLMPEAWVRI